MGITTHFLHSPPLRLISLTPKSQVSALSPLPFSAKPYNLGLHSTHQPLPITTPFSLRHNNKHLALPPPRLSIGPHSLFKTPPSIDVSSITPLTVCKWTAILSVALFAAKKTVSTLLNPFFWTYFSWTWLFWPWFLAISFAVYGLYCFHKHSTGQASVFEQLVIVSSTITWLTLVPPAHFNGFLEGWPIALFFVYHYFFFFESTVRRRLYGDLCPREHDPKWDINLPLPFRVGFAALILVAHWLAAFEGPELHLISGGWANFGTWVLVAMLMFMRYHSILYLSKYSEKVVVPTAVVQFGPYRWVRHPIYASTMLLFALHCITLRAPLSLLFVVAVCLVYYGRKGELEEAVMVETFGQRYEEYMNKVRYKLIPFLY